MFDWRRFSAAGLSGGVDAHGAGEEVAGGDVTAVHGVELFGDAALGGIGLQ